MITRIQYKGHDVLGNLYLDFQKSDGTPYKTIVFAGENGCGKTTILKTLSTFLNGGSILPFDYVEYLQNGNVYQATTDENKGNSIWGKDMFSYGHHYLFELATNKRSSIIVDKKKLNPSDIIYNGCIFSKARSGFNTNNIESVKSNQLDIDKFDDDSSDDFTSTKQLLVDIEAQDASEWMEYSKNNPGADINQYEQKLKMARFRNAFNNFFENIKYSRIKTEKNSKSVVFTKNGKEINVDQLSTGEQQIVFRGTQLLKNSKNINGGIVLIDEPELSMHPKWQSKILDYYKNLFTESGNQTVQMFFATHSEEVIKNALKDKDTLVVVLKNKNGVIESKKIDAPIILPSITAAEINYLAFDIVSTDFHIALFSTLQNANGFSRIKEVDNFILASNLYDSSKHYKPHSYTPVRGCQQNYETLPVYIRNAIDHPDNSCTYSNDELKESIELMIKLINPSYLFP